MIRRLRIKFVCINMAIVTILLCAIFATVLYFTKCNLEQESIRMMQAVASDPLRLGRPDEPRGSIRLPYFAVQLGASNEMLAVGGGYYDLTDYELLGELVSQSTNSAQQIGVLPEYNLRFCRVATPNAQCIVFADMSSEVSTMNSLIQNCLLVGAASFFAFLLISFLLARWAVRPVETAWAQQRQFVADASHELKTPLTVVLANAELLQSEEQDEEARARFSRNILVMSRQMRGLVESLLELARADSGDTQTSFAPVDLSALVSDATLPFEPICFEKGRELVSNLEDGICVRGSDVHLRQLVDILLDNAQKYAAGTGPILVTLRRRHRHCLLSVENPGEQIPADELKNIFKRFYRVDKARSRDGSYGLGLSIAERIVQSHRGKIWAESRNGVNTFFVELPVL